MPATRREAAAALLAAAGASFLSGSAHADPAQAAISPSTADPSSPDDGPPTEVGVGRDAYAHMTAPVGINGSGPYPFLIDTGASASCISRALADQLALQPAPAAHVHTVVGAQMRPCVTIAHLQVGARSRKAVTAPALPLKQAELAGVLGVDWLKGQRLVLDMKNQKMEITRSHSDEEAEHSVVVPARRRMGQLTIVDADMSGHRISAMIDSGSQSALCNTPMRDLIRKIDRTPDRALPHPSVRMETITGEVFTGELIYIPFLRLGGLRMGNVPVVYADVHVFDVWGLKDQPAIILGMDLLSEFETVALDFGRSVVRFDFV